jgi:ABC-2 type transport system ATP-binding protein
MNQPVIAVTDLAKQYGEVTALAGISLTVARGAVLAVLGHNGAGKTTLIDILSTRVRPSAGTARVCGYDVVQRGRAVRRRIGVTGQFEAVDNALSGRGNLVLIARLLGARPRQALARATELIAAFGLEDAADRPAGTYSGGMRRRLDLAAGLVGAPQVLFLDEPTSWVVPVSRAGLWTVVEDLAARGTTVVLTTQYLEEADRLADSIVVVDHGRVIAQGSASELKARLGSTIIHIDVAPEDLEPARSVLAPVGPTAIGDEGRSLEVTVSDSGPAVLDAVRRLDAAAITPSAIAVREPSLDDVFLTLTGRPSEDPTPTVGEDA